MIEVFRANVKDHYHADFLVDRIQTNFQNFETNFDLEDCDKILHIKSSAEIIDSLKLISILKKCGVNAEVFPEPIKKTWP